MVFCHQGTVFKDMNLTNQLRDNTIFQINAEEIEEITLTNNIDINKSFKISAKKT